MKYQSKSYASQKKRLAERRARDLDGELEKRRRIRRKYKYGMTPEQYANQLKKQNGHCALCPSTKRLCVDHCHTTKKFRGILCDDCNVGLGRFKDDPKRLRRAATYVS